jgi:NAD(P)-dependent dehydrogenase (short-subunit alcohol dehydrogenase family)
MQMSGKLVVLVGAAGGLGRAAGRLLAEQGARIAAVDRSEEVATVVSSLPAVEQGEHLALTADISSAQEVDGVFEQILARAGTPDAMVNSAGIREVRGALEISSEEWEQVIGINLSGAFYCARAAARAMVAGGRPGSIVTVSSIGAITGFENRAAYCASKGGTVSLTRALGKDLARHRIRVNAVLPGLTRTEMTDSYFDDPEFAASLERVVPLGRAGTAEDVAHAVLYLASEMSAYVTGTALVVDGGFTATSTYDTPSDRAVGAERRTPEGNG